MIIPNPLDYHVYMEEAVAVAQAAVKSGVARTNRTDNWIRENFEKLRNFFLIYEDPIADKR